MYWRILPTACGLNFHSLLLISTFLLFLSPSEHSTQYATEIIFCWMRFGHKSRADLLRPLHSLFPSLPSTWQFKSLITLTRNPFSAEQSTTYATATPGMWVVLKMVLSPRDRYHDQAPGGRDLPQMVKVSPLQCSLPPVSASRSSPHCHCSQALSSMAS